MKWRWGRRWRPSSVTSRAPCPDCSALLWLILLSTITCTWRCIREPSSAPLRIVTYWLTHAGLRSTPCRTPLQLPQLAATRGRSSLVSVGPGRPSRNCAAVAAEPKALTKMAFQLAWIFAWGFPSQNDPYHCELRYKSVWPPPTSVSCCSYFKSSCHITYWSHALLPKHKREPNWSQSASVVYKIWWLCLTPTSSTRFASEVGYRMAKIQ